MTVDDVRQALVVMGTAGAGKTAVGTAVAAALGVRFIEGDAFHPAANREKMAAGVPLTDDDRAGWLQALAAELRAARAAGQGVVLACSALRRTYRDVLRGGDDRVRFVFLDASRTVLEDRMAARTGHFMPVSLLDSQLATLEPPAADEGALHVDATKPLGAVVADVLARVRPEQHP